MKYGFSPDTFDQGGQQYGKVITVADQVVADGVAGAAQVLNAPRVAHVSPVFIEVVVQENGLVEVVLPGQVGGLLGGVVAGNRVLNVHGQGDILQHLVLVREHFYYFLRILPLLDQEIAEVFHQYKTERYGWHHQQQAEDEL